MKKKATNKIELMMTFDEIVTQTQASEAKYNQERAKYISEKTYYKPGNSWLSTGSYDEDPVRAEADWNKVYPEGYKSWFNERASLNLTGISYIYEKLNEIINAVNKLQK